MSLKGIVCKRQLSLVARFLSFQRPIHVYMMRMPGRTHNDARSGQLMVGPRDERGKWRVIWWSIYKLQRWPNVWLHDNIDLKLLQINVQSRALQFDTIKCCFLFLFFRFFTGWKIWLHLIVLLSLLSLSFCATLNKLIIYFGLKASPHAIDVIPWIFGLILDVFIYVWFDFISSDMNVISSFEHLRKDTKKMVIFCLLTTAKCFNDPRRHLNSNEVIP